MNDLLRIVIRDKKERDEKEITLKLAESKVLACLNVFVSMFYLSYIISLYLSFRPSLSLLFFLSSIIHPLERLSLSFVLSPLFPLVPLFISHPSTLSSFLSFPPVFLYFNPSPSSRPPSSSSFPLPPLSISYPTTLHLHLLSPSFPFSLSNPPFSALSIGLTILFLSPRVNVIVYMCVIYILYIYIYIYIYICLYIYII
jgi:hypothetical protein